MKTLPHGNSRLVRCPGRQQTYRAHVDCGWYFKEVRRTFGYPELLCLECGRAADQAEQTGQPAADQRNPERSAH